MVFLWRPNLERKRNITTLNVMVVFYNRWIQTAPFFQQNVIHQNKIRSCAISVRKAKLSLGNLMRRYKKLREVSILLGPLSVIQLYHGIVSFHSIKHATSAQQFKCSTCSLLIRSGLVSLAIGRHSYTRSRPLLCTRIFPLFTYFFLPI